MFASNASSRALTGKSKSAKPKKVIFCPSTTKSKKLTARTVVKEVPIARAALNPEESSVENVDSGGGPEREAVRMVKTEVSNGKGGTSEVLVVKKSKPEQPDNKEPKSGDNVIVRKRPPQGNKKTDQPRRQSRSNGNPGRVIEVPRPKGQNTGKTIRNRRLPPSKLQPTAESGSGGLSGGASSSEAVKKPVLKAVAPVMKPRLAKRAESEELDRHDALELDRQIIREKAAKTKEDEKKAMMERREQRAQAEMSKREERSVKRRRKKSDPMLIENRRKARQERQAKRQEQSEEEEGETIIEVGSEGLSVEELAKLLAIDPADVVKALFMKGVMVTVNQTIDVDSVKVVAAEMDVIVVDRDEETVGDSAKKTENFVDNFEETINRPPVVTVMGHVDHGKTSLLDYIRKTRVAAGEAGGITQAIGAYTCKVDVEGGERKVCFLDTPGHEAFSAMRARGTKVTDIAVIVIAANDGVRPQTLEAINHAKAAKVPIVIAINKIDVPGADPERVKRELSEIELLPEEWGGQTPVVAISAKSGQGVNTLLEMLTLVSDIQLDLKANPLAMARGTVIEAFLDKRSGVVATLLVQNGTLKLGDFVVAGGCFGKVKSLTDAADQHVDSAGPSTAVRMLGFNEIPVAGDIFAAEEEAEAKADAGKEAEKIRQKHLAETSGGGSIVTLSSLASIDEDSTAIQRINLVLKTDTSGSLEAIKGALAKLPQEAVMIRYLHAAAGDVSESDILLAAAADGMIISFNVPVSESVKSEAKQKGILMQSYSVIYDLIDDVRATMEGRLEPEEDRLSIGRAEVKAVFGSGPNKVAGCAVVEGRLEKRGLVKVTRQKKVVFEGELSSLRRGKDNVNEVYADAECGVGCDDFSNWEQGDKIEAFAIVTKRVSLEESKATLAVDGEELQSLIG